MSLNDDNNDNRPRTPLEEDCCGSGCTPCIFDIHRKLLKEWDSKKKQNIQMEADSNLLSLLSYKAFTIIDISEASQDYILVHLEYKESEVPDDINLHLIPGQHVILHTSCISRPYTPIIWTSKSLTILVKIYKHGKFSMCLKNAMLGTTIDIRGPYGDFKYKTNSFRQIVMFSIGSGIAALFPIAKAIVDDEAEMTKVHLIAGFQSIAHVPLKKELRHLVDYWNFKCTLHLSQVNDKIVNLHGFNIKNGRLDKLFVADYLQFNDIGSTLILICGTLKFNQSMREWIKEMDYTDVYVFE